MRAIKTLVVVAVLFSGCASQPVSTQSCGTKKVLYCVESGSRDCRCLSQEAAQGSLDNL